MQPQLTLIEYPGVFEQDIEDEKITNTLEYIPERKVTTDGDKETMLLNYFPEDRFHQPVHGTVLQCNNKVLVKLRITKPSNTTESLCNATNVKLVEVIGPIKKLVRFRKMSPYQFDVQVPKEWAGLESAVRSLDLASIDEFAQKLVTEEANIESFYPFPPTISTHFDFPNSILGPDMSLTSTRQARPRKATESKPRLPWQASFHDTELPGAPSPEALSLLPHLNTTTAALLKDIFEERPIASRLYASSQSGIDYFDLPKVLPIFGYCFVDGPWLNCWVRYGIDPRSDSNYRFYQIIQCRNTFLSEGLVEEPPKEGLTVQPYLFTGDSSNSLFTQYQFCDLQYSPLSDLVQDTEAVQETCSKSNGWYPSGTIKKMRKIVRQRWVDILQEKNPEAWSKLKKTTRPQDSIEDEPDDDEDYEYYDEE